MPLPKAKPAALERVAVDVKLTAPDVARYQRGLTTELAGLTDLPAITTAEEYTAIDEILREITRKHDAVLAMRKDATGPLYTSIKVIESWFAPVNAAVKPATDHLRKLLGDYRVAQAKAEAQAREAATRAAEADDADALLAALEASTTLERAPRGSAGVRIEWECTAYDREKVSREYLTIDWSAVKLYLKACAAQGVAPNVEGLTFEQTGKVAVKR
jgi:hypothetical protein